MQFIKLTKTNGSNLWIEKTQIQAIEPVYTHYTDSKEHKCTKVYFADTVEKVLETPIQILQTIQYESC